MAELSERLRTILGIAAIAYTIVIAVLLTQSSGDEMELLLFVSVATLGVLVLGAMGTLDHNSLLLGGALVLALLGVYQARTGWTAVAVGTLVASAYIFLRYARHASGDLSTTDDEKSS